MAISKTDIANYALSEVGAETIASIDDATLKSARMCRLHYDQARREVLRRHRWNFAMKRTTLSQLDDDPNWGWNYRFGMPLDYIRLAEVNDVDVWDYTQQAEYFDIEGDEDGRYLMLNLSTAKILYVFDQENLNLFDSLFVAALAQLLAAKICRSLTDDDKLAISLREQYEAFFLPTAQSVDGHETRSNENNPLMNALRRSSFVRARGAFSTERVTPSTDDAAAGVVGSAVIQ